MKIGFLGVFAILAVVAVVVAFNSLFIVRQTEQALVLQFGEPKNVITEPGLKVKVPVVQNVIFLEKRILELDAPPVEVLASDQKRLVVDAYARWRINNPLLFYQSVNNEQVARIRLSNILQSQLRATVASQSFFALLSGERAQIMRTITDGMNAQARTLGIEVVDVRIRRADLPEANSQAIFQRMQTERQREASEARAQGQENAQRIRSRADREVTVIKAEAQRQAEILRGEGDGERNRIFADAYSRDPDFFAFYRSMRAYEEAMQRGDTTMVLSPDSEFFRYFESPQAR